MKLPSADRVFELLRYEPDTGIFRWRKARGGMRVGSVAGFERPDRYIQIKIDGRLILAHVLAWFYETAEWPDEIDHKNRQRGDNRWSNLRLASRAQNIANGDTRKDNKIGIRGVSQHNGKFRARIMYEGEAVFLGHFATIDDAKAAYVEAQREFYGEFATW